MPNNYRGLAFLLSIGSLPLACTKEGNDSDTDSSTGKPNTATDTGDTATDPTSSTAASDPTTTTTGTTTTGPENTSTTTPGSTTFLTSESDSDTSVDTEDVPPPTDPVCIAYAAHVAECMPRYADYRQYIAQQCEYYKAYGVQTDGQACADAYDALYVCYSTVDCAEFGDGEEPPPSCAAQLMAYGVACPSLEGSAGESDTNLDTGDTGDDTSSSG